MQKTQFEHWRGRGLVDGMLRAWHGQSKIERRGLIAESAPRDLVVAAHVRNPTHFRRRNPAATCPDRRTNKQSPEACPVQFEKLVELGRLDLDSYVLRVRRARRKLSAYVR